MIKRWILFLVVSASFYFQATAVVFAADDACPDSFLPQEEAGESKPPDPKRLISFLDHARFIRKNLRMPNEDEGIYTSLDELGKVMASEPEILSKLREFVMAKYTKKSREILRTASIDELAEEMEAPLDFVTALVQSPEIFGSIEEVFTRSYNIEPEAFEQVYNAFIFTPERAQKLLDAWAAPGPKIVACARANAPLHEPLFASLLALADARKAPIFVLAADLKTMGLDKRLLNDPRIHVVTQALDAGGGVIVDPWQVMSKQINPGMGLGRLGQRGIMRIIGSPRSQAIKEATAENDTNPHMVISTGTISAAIDDEGQITFRGRQFMSRRTDRMSLEENYLSVMYVEPAKPLPEFASLQPVNGWHLRRIAFIEGEGLIDLNQLFTPSGDIVEIQPEVLALGDMHITEHEPMLLRRIAALIRATKPKVVIGHDWSNGTSVNHHEEDQPLVLAKRALSGQLNVAAELASDVAFTELMLQVDPEFQLVIAYSNHPAWFKSWATNSDNANDPINGDIWSHLHKIARDGKDPFAEAMLYGFDHKHYGFRGINPQFRARVTFLGPTEDLKASGTHVGGHGHMGASGSRGGSLKALEKTHGNAVIGHTHVPGWIKDLVNVGTSTKLREDYNIGPSAWGQGLSFSYHGKSQLLVFTDGDYANTDPDYTDIVLEAGYPRYIPGTSIDVKVDDPEKATPDQWTE